MNPLKLITKPIGCLCSLLGALILGFLLLGIIGLWSFNRFAKEGVEEIVESRGGFPVTVDEAGWHLLDSEFVAEDIIVQNPPNFPEKDFLHIRSLTIGGDAKEWLAGETRDIDALSIDIQHVNWVISSGGSSNVSLFADAIIEQSEAEARDYDIHQAPVGGEGSEPMEVSVKAWTIRLGTVELSDYSRGEVRREKYILNYERSFTGAEPAVAVVQVVASEFADKGLQPMLHQLLTAILSVPDIEGLTKDLNPTPDWLKEKLGKESK